MEKEEDVLGKRKREFEEELAEVKRTRGAEIALLEQLIKVLPDAAVIVMYQLPYPTIRNFCAASKAIAAFCDRHLDDAFWHAAWLSDRRVFAGQDQKGIDRIASLLLAGAGIGEELWKTLHLPIGARGQTLEKDVARSPRAHIWARYEAVFLSVDLLEGMLKRLDGKWRDAAEAPRGTVDTSLYISVLSDQFNGNNVYWWDDLLETGDIIVSPLPIHGQIRHQLGLSKYDVDPPEAYPVFPVRLPRDVRIPDSAADVLRDATETRMRPVISPRVHGSVPDLAYEAGIELKKKPYFSEDPGGADVESILMDSDAYRDLRIAETFDEFLSSHDYQLRFILFAVPEQEIRWLSDYDGPGSAKVATKGTAVVLFDTDDHAVLSEKSQLELPFNSRFIRYGTGTGRPGVIIIAGELSFIPGRFPRGRDFDPRLFVGARTTFIVEVERNSTPLELVALKGVPAYDVMEDTLQLLIPALRWSSTTLRAHVLTDRLLQERFVDAADREARHRPMSISAPRFADVARVPRDEDARRYALRRIEPVDGGRPYEMIWDRRTGMPFCHHRGLPVGAFAERFRTEREPSLCPDRACGRAHVPLSLE